MKKVLWVKFGWSEYYRGEPVDGNFGWLNEARGGEKEGMGHEAFNFMPVNGTYYCYVPPQAKNSPPWNEDNTGWTVICLAKNPKHTGIHIVGWYEDATLIGSWQKPPTAEGRGDAHAESSPYDWSYCIESKSAFFVPPDQRTNPFSNPSVRQGKYSFLSGPNVKQKDAKAQLLALLRNRLKKLRPVAVHQPSEEVVPDPELDPADPLCGFGTPEVRKRVEQAAEKAVIAYYSKKKYRCTDVTKVKCGYDFLFQRGEVALRVEVKGTSSENAGFFLTRNEHDAGLNMDPTWRLAMVTRALSGEPNVQIFDAKQLRNAFDLTPYVYLGRPVVEPKSK
ncbi:protein NO VEIN domain-containing protein [Aminobacter aminovorans]|uniref:Protein NO VEIN C-terminal domain-containing protein n=1 Tax=Aminobacter aminovorans TaxID=83263 RepID=A0AAC9AQC0_AMIAI|nr:DUF3883 domain-containing protein [Aminobacter aminovorans]AMS40138.1 hypothetical protein AA2016_1203 [Aminobacter aminovorans]MBB3709865.1 hypothetical protein [Aminobacter aminovorans]